MGLKSKPKGFTKKSMELLSAAAGGNQEAQYEIGLRYLRGEEVPEDHKLAIDWLMRSSNQGFEDAQYLLGTCYASGTGVEQNEKIAMGFFLKAAHAANKYAQFEVGEYYHDAEDHVQAYDWYKKSARQGYAPAQYELGKSLFYGLGIMKAEDMAIEWLEKSAAQNHKPAQVLLNRIG